MFISYAQNFEDVLLWRALGHVGAGFYIDIGAQDPIVDSVSLAFYERGWRGVHVEPTPAYAAAIRLARPDETVVQAAVGDAQTLIPFYEIPRTGISTAVAEIAQRHEGAGYANQRLEVPCIPLSTLLDTYRERDIHWMKIDVEGMEHAVLDTWSPSPVRPWVVLVEATLPLSQDQTHQEWEAIIIGLGYRFAYFDGLNRFYVIADRPELLAALRSPPNVFDAFSLSGTASNTFCQRPKDQLELAMQRLQAREVEAAGLIDEIAGLHGRVDQLSKEALRVEQLERQLIEHARADAARAEQTLIESQQLAAALAAAEAARIDAATQREQVATLTAEHLRLSAEVDQWQRRSSAAEAHAKSLAHDLGAARVALEATAKESAARYTDATSQLDLARRSFQDISLQASAARESLARLRRNPLGRLAAWLEGLSSDTSAVAQQAGADVDEPSPAARVSEPDSSVGITMNSLSELPVVRSTRSISELLRYDGRAFVQAAYLTLLQRPADEAGMSYHLSNLQAGVTKHEVLRQLHRSEEGRRRNVMITGLRMSLLRAAGRRSLRRLGLAAPLRTVTASMKLEQILAQHNGAFIDVAYAALLQRAPDAGGHAHYMRRLQAGVPKWRVLADIADSTEAAGRTIPGLDSLVRAHEAARDVSTRAAVEHISALESTANEPVSAQPAASLDKLLALHDESFVRSAYLTLLGRQADPTGFAYYLARLRHGVAKGRIVAEIARSPEGRKRIVQLPGLRALRWRYRRRLPSVLGHLLRRPLLVALEPLEMQLRSTENLVIRLQQESTGKFARFEGALGGLLPQFTNGAAPLPRTHTATWLSPPNNTGPGAGAEEVPPRICVYVDHTVACPTNTGMQRVTRRLGDALVRLAADVWFVRWDPKQKCLALIDQEQLRYLGEWSGPKPANWSSYPVASDTVDALPALAPGRAGWLVVPEVTHITFQTEPKTLDVMNTARRLGFRLAFVFYDATPLRRAELRDMAEAHATYMQQLLLSDVVFPISRWVGHDLSNFLRHDQLAEMGPMPQIVPLPLPGESHLASRRQASVVATDASSYILSVGSIVAHKNQLLLVEAFDRYCRMHPTTEWTLQLAGNLQPNLSDKLAKFTASNSRIRYLGEVTDEALVELYRGCSFSVFPSIMEGFGLPILESLWFGKPCICANFGAMAEVAAGGGCIAVDTSDAEQLYHAISGLIDDRHRLKELAAAATARHIDSWSEYATALVQNLGRTVDPAVRVGRVYYWIDHTSTYPGNSGIQRVTRGLARALIEAGLELIPVRWSEQLREIAPATDEALVHLAKWNGPSPSTWAPWKPVEPTSAAWLLVPELTHYLHETGPQDIQRFCRTAGLRCAWVFHDSIPWKLRDLYPPEAAEAHRRYMLALAGAEKVLATSRLTRSDLLSFLSAAPVRCGRIEDDISVCTLPAELVGQPRVLAPKLTREGPTMRVLCVGTVEPRKNHLVLLQAYRLARQSCSVPIELTLVGASPIPDLAHQVQRLVDDLPACSWVRNADDAHLRRLYQECDFTVYPSFEEGFGLPILESLWNGRPCICANFGAMAEAAEDGGCLTVDVRESSQLAAALEQLAQDDDGRFRLAQQAIARRFRTWQDYGRDVIVALANERARVFQVTADVSLSDPDALYRAMPNLKPRPLLSVCISTYNRAAWLSLSLKNLQRLLPTPLPEVEILVCDNTSTDSTPDVVQPFLGRADFRYVRNDENVGMLGNLRVTANHARGQYVWILGDDDLLKQGSIERVLDALRRNPRVALVYLNYAYTREERAERVVDLVRFLEESTPIVEPSDDIVGTVRDVCTCSENFFTAIYCLVFRRDHAIRAYSQNTSGRPFSTMLTCIPTTHYVLNFMMNESAYWVGIPQLVVNMNVSWMRYAPLWILERLPEVFDLSEKLGADPDKIDRWRVHNIPGVVHFFEKILSDDPEGNAAYVSVPRLLNSFKHLPEFQEPAKTLKALYRKAHEARNPLAPDAPDLVFSAFN